MSKEVEVEVLIISNKMDFATDLICIELNKRKNRYLRINRDMFANYKIKVDVDNIIMRVEISNQKYIVNNEKLKSIYFRAPVFLRDNFKNNYTVEEQLYRSQWMAFIRNLTIFDRSKWVNNPNSTFMAENKMLQLKKAKEIGFYIPNTKLVNTLKDLEISNEELYIVKSLDTALIRNSNRESFVYTNLVLGSELKQSRLDIAPIILQEYIKNKVDLRVTVIGEKVFPVKILKNESGIDGDWRKEKENVQYIPSDLPIEIQDMCIKITKIFNLSFGGIDLLESNNKYYFIEINPTGEWSWLVQQSKIDIDKYICDYLLEN